MWQNCLVKIKTALLKGLRQGRSVGILPVPCPRRPIDKKKAVDRTCHNSPSWPTAAGQYRDLTGFPLLSLGLTDR
jgi:hypothetical protein